jgi:hypothetical protein
MMDAGASPNPSRITASLAVTGKRARWPGARRAKERGAVENFLLEVLEIEINHGCDE